MLSISLPRIFEDQGSGYPLRVSKVTLKWTGPVQIFTKGQLGSNLLSNLPSTCLSTTRHAGYPQCWIRLLHQPCTVQVAPPSWVSSPGAEAGTVAAFRAVVPSVPTHEEVEEGHRCEMLAGEEAHDRPLISALDHEYLAGYLVAGQQTVRMITWPRLKAAAAESPVYQSLLQHLAAGPPEDREAWPEVLQPYFKYMQSLLTTDGVVMCGERPLIPPSLRQEVLEHLHGAHHGVTYIMSRASQSVFWPQLKADILDWYFPIQIPFKCWGWRNLLYIMFLTLSSSN